MKRVVWSAGILVSGLHFADPMQLRLDSGETNRGTEHRSPPACHIRPDHLAATVAGTQSFEEQNALFDRKDGWIGADGAHSVALDADRTLWLFSDTWVGSIRGGKRIDATIVNNSAAIQDGRGRSAKIQFFVRRGADNEPQALIVPTDGHGWFWLQAGVTLDERVALFLSQVEKTGTPGVFGFRQVGQWLGIIDNPHDGPISWRVAQTRLPHTLFADKRQVTFGAALLKRGDWLFVYGTDEDVHPNARDRHLIVARVPAKKLGDFASWEFFHDGGWEADFRKASRLVPGMASDCSVTYQAAHGQYLLLYTECGLSERILARTAPDPWGPWSEPETVYRCPEVGWDPRVFCYNAKAHGALASNNELVVSYIANSSDLWHVATDARLYWPRFVRIRLESK